jgi:alpha-1,2-glucosyltransferase
VLGDKANHVAGVHFPQLCYFAAASTLFAWPTLLLGGGTSPLRKLRRTLQDLASSPIASLVSLAIILIVIHRFTIFHPFTLADNRHYVFYVRRYILDPHPYARYVLGPIYLICFKLWYDHLKHTQSLLWIVGLAGSTALVLVPSPLIEPRYFLVPYVFMRLHGASGRSRKQNTAGGGATRSTKEQSSCITSGLIELVFNTVVNLVIVSIFLYRPFKWPTEEGNQRFMW